MTEFTGNALLLGTTRNQGRWPDLLRRTGWSQGRHADSELSDLTSEGLVALCQAADIRLLIVGGQQAISLARGFVRAHRNHKEWSYLYVLAIHDGMDGGTRTILRKDGFDAVMSVDADDHDILDRLAVAARICRLEDELGNANRLQRERLAELNEDLKRAAQVQRSLLPRVRSWPAGVAVHWEWVPSTRLGGDALCVFLVDDRYLVFTVLDVMGHGSGAALLAVQVIRALMPTLGESSIVLSSNDSKTPATPAVVLEQLDQLFPYGTKPGFMTVLHGMLDLHTWKLDLASAGHPGPIIIDADGTRRDPVIVGTAIAMGLPPSHERVSTEIPPGCTVCCFSDGALEAFTPDGRAFGRDGIVQHLHAPADKVIPAVIAGIGAWTGSSQPDDDITMLVIRRLG